MTKNLGSAIEKLNFSPPLKEYQNYPISIIYDICIFIEDFK
jgi:hypothetical protein